MSTLRLLNDQPIGEGTSFSNDGLGFKVYSKILGEVILNTPTPFTVGVFGEWGTGKTSLMRMIEKHVTDIDKENVITIWFNAWQFGNEDHPIVPLAIHIVKQLKKEKNFTKSLGDTGEVLLDVLESLVAGFSFKGKLSAGVAEIEGGIDAGKSLERQDKLIKDQSLGNSLYYDIFEALSNLNINKSKRLIVFIDDLDRCLPNTTIKLLEAIKLVLAHSGFTFVLGVSRSVIEGYLQHRYEIEFGLKEYDGRSYFDKIIQLPFYIPPHSSRMNRFSTQILSRLDKENQKALSEYTKTIGSACKNNPRSVIRFINNLIIDVAINRSLFESGEMDKIIPIGDFALTRALQQNWNEFNMLLLKSPGLGKKVADWDSIEKLLEAKLSTETNQDEKKLAEELINDKELFNTLSTDAAKKLLSNEQQRKEAVEFLLTERVDSLPLNNEEFEVTCQNCGRKYKFALTQESLPYARFVNTVCPNCSSKNRHDLAELRRSDGVVYR